MARQMTEDELAEYIRVELDMATKFDEMGRDDLALACISAAHIARAMLERDNDLHDALFESHPLA